MGGAADPVDAASRGITAGTLGSACVNLLNDLEDCLLTGKLHEAFLAAVKISDYRSRLYVLRLLLDRVPADRLHAAKALVTALALSRRDADAAEKNDGTRCFPRRDPSRPVERVEIARRRAGPRAARFGSLRAARQGRARRGTR
jgi:hypothetical protein